VLSRIAENMYWIGRYIERAENTARLLDVNYLALIEAPLVPGTRGIVTEQWAPLLSITGNEAGFREHFERADAASVPLWLALSYHNPGSIRSSLGFARENARALRERISTEMWEAINLAYHRLCLEAPQLLEEDTLHDYCVCAREASHLFFGIADATLPRDLGWYFVRAGQYLERADNTLRTLMVRYRQYRGQSPVAEGIEAHRSMALLKSLSAFEAFRKRHYVVQDPQLIADFLLLDPCFPRSVRFCVRVLYEILCEIAQQNPGTSLEPRRQAGYLSAQLEYLKDVTQITEDDNPSLDALLASLADISSALTATYFLSNAPEQRQTQQLG
jgi:uncharacterized alpha-E superfamily protein